jgi:antirestriction protein ArdC
VPFTLLNGNVQGFSVGRELAINPVAADPLRTTLHELGHIVLGHTALTPEAVDDYREHRGIKEFQAEATAHLALNETGNLTAEAASHSRGYIQHWLADERPSDGVIRAVFAATDAILKAGREPVTAEVPTHV